MSMERWWNDTDRGKHSRLTRRKTCNSANVVPNVKKSGALTYPEPLWPSRRPTVGETFTLHEDQYISDHISLNYS